MNIRVATLEDTLLLARLNLAVHQIHVEAHPDKFKPVSAEDPGLLKFYQAMIADRDTVVYIVEVDEGAAGYVIARIVHRPENVFSYAMSALYIDQISVNPEYRKRGCGEALIQAVFALAQERGISRVLLDVWEFNENARTFFARQGFKIFNYRMEIDL